MGARSFVGTHTSASASCRSGPATPWIVIAAGLLLRTAVRPGRTQSYGLTRSPGDCARAVPSTTTPEELVARTLTRRHARMVSAGPGERSAATTLDPVVSKCDSSHDCFAVRPIRVLGTLASQRGHATGLYPLFHSRIPRTGGLAARRGACGRVPTLFGTSTHLGAHDMRVLLTAWGSRGDLQPLAALAVGLREHGAEVRVCAPPDEEFVDLFARAGATLIPLGPSTRSIAAGLKAPSADAAFRLAAELVAARFETLPAAVEGCDAIVATGLMPAGARDVAESLGIRYVLATFHIFGLPSRHFAPASRPGKQSPAGETDNRVLWAQDAERVNALYAEPLNRGRAAIGLPPVGNVRDHVLADQVWLAADPVLAPWKDLTDLDIVQTGAWILPDDRPLPDELDDFLDAGEPPVFVGFGSMAMRTSPDLGRVAIEAARANGRRLILGRGWADLALSGATDDYLVVGDVNHQALFPRVAALVHHGGAGTTTTAALAGVPQVVVPQIVDQPHWARRVAELGIGAAHDGPVPTSESLADALGTALSRETRARATAVAAQVRTDGAAVAARRLLES